MALKKKIYFEDDFNKAGISIELREKYKSAQLYERILKKSSVLAENFQAYKSLTNVQQKIVIDLASSKSSKRYKSESKSASSDSAKSVEQRRAEHIWNKLVEMNEELLTDDVPDPVEHEKVVTNSARVSRERINFSIATTGIIPEHKFTTELNNFLRFYRTDKRISNVHQYMKYKRP